MLPVACVIGHREWAPNRKIDPRYDMNWRRAGVAGIQPKGGAFMALSEAQQIEMYHRIVYIDQQIGGDLDAGGPEREGWPARRNNVPTQPNLTIAAAALECDRELNSRHNLAGRPGPDTDTMLGQVLSTRQEVRNFQVAMNTALTALAAKIDGLVAAHDPKAPS